MPQRVVAEKQILEEPPLSKAFAWLCRATPVPVYVRKRLRAVPRNSVAITQAAFAYCLPEKFSHIEILYPQHPIWSRSEDFSFPSTLLHEAAHATMLFTGRIKRLRSLDLEPQPNSLGYQVEELVANLVVCSIGPDLGLLCKGYYRQSKFLMNSGLQDQYVELAVSEVMCAIAWLYKRVHRTPMRTIDDDLPRLQWRTYP